MKRLGFGLLAAAVMACGGPVATGGQDSGPPAGPGTFSEIYKTIFPLETRAQCSFCHTNPPNQISNGKFSTGADQASAYAAIVNQKSVSAGCGGKTYVVPGHPEQSLFYLKLIDPVPCGGGRMPLGGDPLSAAQLEMIRSWIEAGALDN